MRVLFVCSGNNTKFTVAPFIAEQAESLKRKGIEVCYFPIVGRGIAGYLKASAALRKYLRKQSFDLIHAHFTLSGWTAVLGARATPVVLSLMGDDAYGVYTDVNKVRLSSRMFTVMTWLIQPFVHAIISKSDNIEKYVYLKRKSYIIPNGVDTTRFHQVFVKDKLEYFDYNKKKILFLGNRDERRKNYLLVQSALSIIGNTEVELINPYPVAHAEIPALLSDADVLAVPSLMEGSPNIVKEAMACNCPIVATDTGDIRWVIGNTPGCYVSSFNKQEFAAKLKLALRFSSEKGRTDGAQRLAKLGLDESSIANKVIDVYKTVLSK